MLSLTLDTWFHTAQRHSVEDAESDSGTGRYQDQRLSEGSLSLDSQKCFYRKGFGSLAELFGFSKLECW